jgi:hypothetical protein
MRRKCNGTDFKHVLLRLQSCNAAVYVLQQFHVCGVLHVEGPGVADVNNHVSLRTNKREYSTSGERERDKTRMTTMERQMLVTDMGSCHTHRLLVLNPLFGLPRFIKQL